MFQQEQHWFQSAYLKPREVWIDLHLDTENLVEFQDLILNSPTRRMLPYYDSIPEQLARLCGEGPNGWLCSSHIVWVVDCVNEAQNTTLALCISAQTPYELAGMMRWRDLSNIQRLALVASVGKNGADNSTFFATSQKSGSHWILITVELTDVPVIRYCDSQGWSCPRDLLPVLSQYTRHFGLTELRDVSLQLMNTMTP